MSTENKKAVEVPVASKDGDAKKPEDKKDLSDEDTRIKEEVELLVNRTVESAKDIAQTALTTLSNMLRTASGSVASIPKPLKFIRPHYQRLVAFEKTLADGALKPKVNDLISFIAMTMDTSDGQTALQYKLRGTVDDLSEWGHEYMRHLSGEVAAEWSAREEAGKGKDDLIQLARQIFSFTMQHNDEAAACDLALEVGNPAWIKEFCDESNFLRVAQYMGTTAKYLPVPENRTLLDVVFDICLEHKAYGEALRVAITLSSAAKATNVFEVCDNDAVKRQLALICARHRFAIELEDEELMELIGNNKLSEWYLHTARDLDSMAPKTPDDVYKNYLIDQRAVPSQTNSHMQNLASTFVNGFINAGFGVDKLLATEGTTYIYQTREHRMMAASASCGLVHLWDHTDGLGQVDKYTYSEDNYIKAGALLATGMLMSSIRSSYEPAIVLLSDYLANTHREVRIGAIVGLGFAYAGSQKADVKDLLVPLVADGDQPTEIQCFAAYSLGLVFTGSCDEDVSEAAIACLMEKDDTQLREPCIRYLILALGMLFMGREELSDTLIEATSALSPFIQKYTEVVVTGCAYAGTGNVVMIQKMFALAAETKPEEDDADASKEAAKEGEEKKDKPDDKAEEKEAEDALKSLNYRAAAVSSIGLIAMGEDLGADMTKRSLLHVLMIDQASKLESSESGRRAVPLALALLSVSNPEMPIVESLSKLSHDSDINTAMSAILGLGIVAAGTNNARVATLLRSLSSYYSKEKDAQLLFVVRISQGLVGLGKGHITLSPTHFDRQLVSPTAVCGILGLIHSAFDFDKTILDRYHFMMYSIVTAMYPRMLLTIDGELNPVQTEVRVGQPVDTVAVAGKPKSITGFQTHKTPVLMNEGDRAEMSIGKHKVITGVVQGVVIVEEKPGTEERE